MRGYFGIGIYSVKTPDNVGGLWRSAHAMGASFIFTIGARYSFRRIDTTKAWKTVPLFQYDDFDSFIESFPKDCCLIAVENKGACDLRGFTHPERAVYILGAEDNGLSDLILEKADAVIEIPSTYCLNVATAGSIVVYDRLCKSI